MVYVDQNGNRIENPDLTKGYLVDSAWIDHPGTPQKGHYEYIRRPEGGVVQTYVIDEPAQGGWREVTVQKYIPYAPEGDMETRVAALEEQGAMLMECVLEMSTVVYA